MSLKIPDKGTKNFNRPLSGDIRSEFIDWLASHGMTPDPKKGLVVGGDVGRAYNDKTNKLHGWYQLWVDQEIPYGHLGDYVVDPEEPIQKWNPQNAGAYEMTPEQRAQFLEQQKEQKRLLRLEQEKSRKETQAKARQIWDDLSEDVADNAYLLRKRVLGHGVRQTPAGELVVPVSKLKTKKGSNKPDIVLVGLQYIHPDPDAELGKWYLKGTEAGGAFFVIGSDLMRDAHTINYVEGYATGASYFEDMGQPVVVCFSAGNLSKVAPEICKLLPKAKHVFIADNDESGAGQEAAEKAARLVQQEGSQTEVKMPLERGDYNDHKNRAQSEPLEGEYLPEMHVTQEVKAQKWEKSATNKMLNVKENVRAVLEINQIEVRYNVIKKDLEINVPHQDFVADLQKDAALVEVENRCRHMGVPATNVRDYLKLLAVEYNPVKDWIESKPWDGISRLEEFLGTIKSSNEPLKKMLMSKWLLSCIAAVYEPNGVALEGILVFQGEQGLGKTLWFKRLADYDKGWLLEGATLNPSDKDSVKQAVSHWIVELGEIESTFKKSDIDQLKAFVTKKGDELRLPYDRAFTSYQRRTAFYASVNAREFLTDTSGNRRFWVVPVTDIKADHGIDMQQLWAEIKETLYANTNYDWFLNKAERDMLQDSNESYRTQSSVEDLILQHVNFKGVNTRPVQMTQLLRDLGITQPRVPDVKDASRVLNAFGVEPRRSNGKKVYDLEYTKVEVGNADKFSGAWKDEF